MKELLIDAKLITVLSLICLLLIFFDKLNFLYYPKLATQTITVPIQYGLFQSTQVIGRQLSFIATARLAASENIALKKQLAETLLEKIKFEREIKEIRDISEQNRTLDPTIFSLTPARIIGIGRYLTLDIGLDKQVAVSQVVLFKDQYIGMIRSVSAKTSQVLLPSDPDSKIAVFSQNKSGRGKGILQGQFGAEMLIDKILHQEPIEVGDIVYSEGLGNSLPRGLVIGIVSEIFTRENEVFKQAKVKPIITIDTLNLVFVMEGE